MGGQSHVCASQRTDATAGSRIRRHQVRPVRGTHCGRHLRRSTGHVVETARTAAKILGGIGSERLAHSSGRYALTAGVAERQRGQQRVRTATCRGDDLLISLRNACVSFILQLRSHITSKRKTSHRYISPVSSTSVSLHQSSHPDRLASVPINWHSAMRSESETAAAGRRHPHLYRVIELLGEHIHHFRHGVQRFALDIFGVTLISSDRKT